MKDHNLERLARRRAGMKLGWLLHASVYLLVNSFLFAIAQHKGHTWAIYPALGWGLGLLIHGAAVYLQGSGLYEHQVARERERLGLGPKP